MIDIKLIRETPEVIIRDLEKRRDKEKLAWIEKIQKLDEQVRKLKYEADGLRSERNKVSKEISEAKKQGKDPQDLFARAKEIPQQIKEIEDEQSVIVQKITSYLMRLPNITHESVPFGVDDSQNLTVQEYGVKPHFDFEAKSHVDLLDLIDGADMERAAKISGARFYYLKGDLALLDFALQRYAIDFMNQKGFQLVIPPYMMRREAYEGVTDVSEFEESLYKIEGEDLYLIATSEHPLTAMYMNEVLDENKFPIKMFGISPCFRKEAGSHGKDTKGIFRVHHFNKIEQIILCKPEESWKFHEELTQNAVDFFDSLGFYFRKINICTGDLGVVAAKKFDLEVYMPVQGTFREVVSSSNCTDYQSRRLQIRYRSSDGNKLIHTLNSTCAATSRVLVAILENYQNKDGSITIPPVLRPYMNGKERIEVKK